MKTAVDTNVFSRLWLGGVDGLQAGRALRRCSQEGELIVSPIVFAEMIANRTVSEADILRALQESRVRVDYDASPEVWLEAGRRYRAYAHRKRMSGGGESRRLVADFVVGAHALLRAGRLLTFDVKHFRSDFSELVLVDTQ